MSEIFHITTKSAWTAAQEIGSFSDPSLEEEGFIHCSEAHQVLAPANRLYHGRSDLLLLRINPCLLKEKLVYEDSYGHGTFPHVYGPINIDAVTETVVFPCQEDGSFGLPAEVEAD